MRTIVVAGLLVLSSCSSPAVNACDAAIQATLRSPATYKRVSIEGAERIEPTILRITYDAANLYGTTVRSAGTCDYGVPQGRAVWTPDPVKSRDY